MDENMQTDEDTWVVVDDTTIYEVDVNCYRCLPQKKQCRRELELENDITN